MRNILKPKNNAAPSVSRRSVKTRLLISYGLAAIITLATAAIGIFTFLKVRTDLENIIDNGFKSVDVAHQLAQEIRSIAALAPTILSAHVQSQSLTISDRITDQMTWVEELIGNLYQLGLSDVDIIVSHQTNLLNTYKELNQRVGERIDADIALSARLTELNNEYQKVNEQIALYRSEHPFDARTQTHFELLLSNIMNLLVAAATAPNLEDLARIRVNFEKLLSVTSGTQNKLAEFDHLIKPLLSYGAGENGIFALHARELEAQDAAERLAFVYNRHANRLVFAASALIAASKQNIAEQDKLLRQQLENRGALLFLIALFCIASAFFLARHIGRNIGDRLSLLEHSMKLHAAGGSGEIPLDGNDEITRMAQALGTFIDKIREREEALRTSEERFRDFAEASADWFFEINANFELSPSTPLDTTTDISMEHLAKIAGNFRDSIQSDNDEARQFLALWQAHRPFEDYEVEAADPTGEVICYRLSGKPLFQNDTAFLGYRIAGRDVTEAHKLAEQLKHQARHDALTGLVNRREFERRLKRLLQMSCNDHEQHCLGYFDLDQFKIINDTCGHIAGDELLRQISGLLTQKVRKRDTLARLGGDEFGLLMEHCTPQQAERVTEQIRNAIAEFRFSWENRQFNVGVSIGLVPITAESGDLTSVLRAADSACYAAKDAGRNRIHIYYENDEILAKRHGEMQWTSRLSSALEEQRLRLYQQPIVPAHTSDNQGRHFEILLRMLDTDGSLIAPGAFLPAAERYNMSMQLDRWVVRATMEWLAANPQIMRDLYLCSINISGQSIGHDFFSYIIATLKDTGMPPHKLCFEITETAAIANLAIAEHFIHDLKQQGCQFALDDFGSGLSSFGYLKNLPIDFLKIDGQFVRDIVDDEIDAAMVKSINEIGHIMGKQTIAEFVESSAIAQKLTSLGVDYLQGYGIGKPEPIENLLTHQTPVAFSGKA